MDDTTKLGEPIVQRLDRGMRMLWPVGGPDDEGFQTYAALSVECDGRPAFRYASRLRRAEIKRESRWSTENFSALNSDSLTLNSVETRRFSRAKLRRLADEALRTVRERYDEGDPEVRRFFGPARTSDRHD